MKSNELLNKDKKELQELLVLNQEKLRDLRFKAANAQLKNIREIRATRALIAHILTQLNKLK